MQLILLDKFFHDTCAFISYYDLGLFLTSAVFLCAGASLRNLFYGKNAWIFIAEERLCFAYLFCLIISFFLLFQTSR